MKNSILQYKKLLSGCLNKNNHEGFTIPELIVTVMVFSILTGFITINLVNLQRKTTLSAFVTTLISDIKDQQIKAMTGYTEGRASADNYGIHFESNRYVFYHGDSYNPNDKSNFVTEIQPPLEFINISLPSGNLLFTLGSGKINGFVSGQDHIIIQNTQSTEQKTIKLNKFGVITQAE